MKTLMAIVFCLVVSPVMFAQSSPVHSGAHATRSDIPDRTDHPTGSAEKQAAMEASNSGSSYNMSEGNTTTPESAKGSQGADHTTTGEVEDLAANFKKIREAREAKAKKEKEAAAKQ